MPPAKTGATVVVQVCTKDFRHILVWVKAGTRAIRMHFSQEILTQVLKASKRGGGIAYRSRESVNVCNSCVPVLVCNSCLCTVGLKGLKKPNKLRSVPEAPSLVFWSGN